MKRIEINVKVPEEDTEPKILCFKKRNVMHTDFIYFVQIIL